MAKKLHSIGENLILVDNFARGKEDQEFLEFLDKPNVKFYNIDITRENAFSVIEENIKYIYHLAAINGTENFYLIPDKVLRVNVIGTLNLLDWIKINLILKYFFRLLLRFMQELYLWVLVQFLMKKSQYVLKILLILGGRMD